MVENPAEMETRVFDMKLLVRDIFERSYQHQIGIQVIGLQGIAI